MPLRILNKVLTSAKSEALDEDMLELVQAVQKNAIALTVSTAELVELIKMKDPEYAKAIKEME